MGSLLNQVEELVIEPGGLPRQVASMNKGSRPLEAALRARRQRAAVFRADASSGCCAGPRHWKIAGAAQGVLPLKFAWVFVAVAVESGTSAPVTRLTLRAVRQDKTALQVRDLSQVQLKVAVRAGSNYKHLAAVQPARAAR